MRKRPLFRVGGRVVTKDGFFAKIMRISGPPDALVLVLDVAGVGLREGVIASQVTPSDRRSVPISPSARPSTSPLHRPLVSSAPTAAGKSRSSSPPRCDAPLDDFAGIGKQISHAADLNASLDEERARFVKASEALDSILSENSRLHDSLEQERQLH